MLKKKIFAIVLALLLIGIAALALNIQAIKAEPKTWTVDDDGPADFHTIQEAVNAASPGDAICVYNGTYYERVIVNTTVSLSGENRENTIIDGDGTGTVVTVTASSVNLSDFTIQHSGSWWPDSGIHLNNVNNCSVTSNIVANNGYFGILLNSSSCNALSDNIIANNNFYGIGLAWSPGFGGSSYNTLWGNTITKNYAYGVFFYASGDNTLFGNIITNNSVGVYFYYESRFNKIYHNNFIENTEQVVISTGIGQKTENTLDDDYPSGGNYWSDYAGTDLYSGPYQNVTGNDGIGDVPYIFNADNTDRYPLMHPWSPLPVHNINTGLGYSAIQEAINAPETLHGHTIFVEAGTYYENVVVNKTLWLAGASQETTIIDANEIGRVIDVTANNVTIEGFTLRNGGEDGICISGYNQTTIRNNGIVSNLWNGIRVWASVNNYISGNNITNNGNDGVNVGASSNDNIVSGNNIVSNGGGIQIGSSDNNLVLGNNITNNGYRGIWLSDSTNNTISENVMNGNKHHFYVGGIKLADFMHSIEVSNLVDGKPVYYLVNHTDLVISPLTYPHVGWLALINCSNADVKGLTFTDNGQGLLLAYTSNSRIIGNKVTNNDYGIYLESSSNCSISGNNITNNYAGIWHRCSSNNNIYENNIKANDHGVNLWDSSNSSISGNNLMNNRWCGIEVEHSSNNTIYQNNITNNGYGINLYVSLNNIINGNDMKTNYRGIVLAYSLNNSIVGNNLIGNSYGFQLDSSNYNIISGNDVTANNLAGILLRGSAYNKISRNNITNNGEGIVLQKSVYDSDSSNYNIISENNVVSNLAGIGLSYSSNNVVYHNNFINNTSQVYSVGSVNVWDDGYPSGGNYWSNYTGVDFHSGSDQDETGSDSIGDTAHEIDADNRDRYPLMAPFTTFDAGIWNGEACSVDIISNSTLSDFKLDATQKTLSFNVTGIEGKAGFCRITIPNIVVQDLWQGNYTVLLNGEPWPFRNWTDATNTYIYINYTHSEHQIIIIPEFPSAIVFPLFMIFTLVAFVLRKKRGMGHHKRGG